MTEKQKREKLVELIKKLILENGDMSGLLLRMADIIGDERMIDLSKRVVQDNEAIIIETGTAVIQIMEDTDDNAPA